MKTNARLTAKNIIEIADEIRFGKGDQQATFLDNLFFISIQHVLPKN